MPGSSIALTFDPFTLPTAQHRAGLTGLIILIETMRRRGIGPLPDLRGSGDRWTVDLTEDSVQATMADLYSAATEEREYSKKLTTGKKDSKKVIPPKREEMVEDPKTGKTKCVYVYDQTVPRAPFLQCLGIPPGWLKLWREVVWSTIRGLPMTRVPYESTAAGETVDEASKLWSALQRFQKAREKGAFTTVELSSSLYLGAQAAHADNIPFCGRTDETLLLHFWPVVMQVFVPRAIDRKGDSSDSGYVIAVPDVTDIAGFSDDYPGIVAGLSADMSGYRPTHAIVSVPEEGALEYAARVAAVVRARVGQSIVSYTASSIEVYHLQKRGNSIPMLHAGRLAVTSSVLDGYAAIRRRYTHPLFRRQLILNLLRGRPWYSNFDSVLDIVPHKQLVGADSGWFQSDVRKKFALEKETHRDA